MQSETSWPIPLWERSACATVNASVVFSSWSVFVFVPLPQFSHCRWYGYREESDVFVELLSENVCVVKLIKNDLDSNLKNWTPSTTILVEQNINHRPAVPLHGLLCFDTYLLRSSEHHAVCLKLNDPKLRTHLFFCRLGSSSVLPLRRALALGRLRAMFRLSEI